MDFELARFNMIEQQVRPWDVLDQDVLDSLLVVKRELFVPPAYRELAFSDLEVPLNLDGLVTGEAMFPPRVEARLMQALDVQPHESVIEVGAGSGYMAALLAHRARHVTSFELNEELAAFARSNLTAAGVTNVDIVHRNGAELISDTQVLTDVIVLSGGVEVLPAELINRLNPGGRLVAIVGKSPVMTAQLVSLSADRQPISKTLFETMARSLVGFPVQDRFTF
ncbi:MAG: protein-L-isoaspartate O-methyltransferase family protein [Burkholderiaceae bacterium]